MTRSTNDFDFSALTACLVNCTLEPSPTLSHTQGLMDVSKAIMAKHGVTIDEFGMVDFVVAPGVYPDMTEAVVGGGQMRDDWPALAADILAADILVVGAPIWLGDKSSVATHLIERPYSMSGSITRTPSIGSCWPPVQASAVFSGKASRAASARRRRILQTISEMSAIAATTAAPPRPTAFSMVW